MTTIGDSKWKSIEQNQRLPWSVLLIDRTKLSVNRLGYFIKFFATNFTLALFENVFLSLYCWGFGENWATFYSRI